MKTHVTPIILLFALLASGCATISPAPEATRISLVARPSSTVAIRQPGLWRVDDNLVLAGSVSRQFGSKPSKGNYLDIVFYDTTGTKLHVTPAHYFPADLRIRMRGAQPVGRYIVTLPSLPPGTTKIEVSAHGEPQGQGDRKT